MNSEQNSVPLNALLAILRVLVGVLEQLPAAIEEEVQSWMPSKDPRWGSLLGPLLAPLSDVPAKNLVKPIIDRYDLDREVLPMLQERLEDMMEACEGSSARYLRASSGRKWGRIDRTIAAGAESLSPHGKAWVMFCRETEALLIQLLDEG